MTTQSEPLKPINYDKLRKDYLRDMAEIEGKEVIKTPETLETPSELDKLSLEQFFLKLGYHRHKPNPAKRYVFKVGGGSLTKLEAIELRAAIERLMVDEVRKWLQKTQRDFVRGESSNAFDEGRTYEQFLNKQLLAQLSNTKGEQLDETN